MGKPPLSQSSQGRRCVDILVRWGWSQFLLLFPIILLLLDCLALEQICPVHPGQRAASAGWFQIFLAGPDRNHY